MGAWTIFDLSGFKSIYRINSNKYESFLANNNFAILHPDTNFKTELAAKSTTYLNLSMPSWGPNTASPGGISRYWPAAYLSVALGYSSARYHLGRACLKLDRRAILSNFPFRLEKTSSTPLFFYRVPTAPRSRPFRVRLPSMRRTLIFSRVALPSKKLSLQ